MLLIQIVDDICDSGRTLANLVQTFAKEFKDIRVWTAVLVSKRDAREELSVSEDFVAFNIPNKFIVGFGMDYNEMFRDLNHICVMSPEGIEKYKCKETPTN